MSDAHVRAATTDDVEAIVGMVYDLARYERAESDCHLTADQLRAALFGPHPAAFALVADQDGAPGGFALYFLNFSTWEGVHGIYLEDLYVRPELRGSGLGKALLSGLAQIAVERGYARVEWSVLNWNTPSIDFYLSLGALPQSEWTRFRLSGDAVRQVASWRSSAESVG